MKKLFLDANVFLEAFLKRIPTCVHDRQLLEDAEERRIGVYTSSALLLTVMYFLKKEGYPIEGVVQISNRVLNVTTLVSPTEKTFRQGLYSGFTDLEDGIQYHTALQASNLDYFITNNKKDFKAATALLPVLTPKEFLAL